MIIGAYRRCMRGGCLRRRSVMLLLLLWNWRRGTNKILIVVILVLFHTDPCHLGNDASLPRRNWLLVLCDVHPNRHGALFSVGSRIQRTLKSKVILARQRKGVPNSSQRWRSSLLPRFRGQKNVRVGFFVPIFRDKVPFETA